MQPGHLSIPVYCTDTFPPPEHANDSECLARCTPTQKLYLCKKNSHPYLAASEWICGHLARGCGLSVPNFAAVKVEGRNDYLFGSEWVEGAMSYAVALPSVTNVDIFSQGVAIDYGVGNPDRHLENYLYVEKDGAVRAELIDFSRGFLVAGWPLPDLPMDEMDATIEAIGLWKAHHPFMIEEANAIISRWINLPHDFLDDVLESAAPGWLDDTMKFKLLVWWKSQLRIQRAHDAAYHLKYI
jgi:hypothetical protein